VRWLIARVSLAAALVSSVSTGAAARDPASLLPLPQLGTFHANSHPRLPKKWRATYLMAPFRQRQLALGEIVYDASLPAMRVRLYGVTRGSADLFVLGNTTYVLAQTVRQGEAPRPHFYLLR
jgi:hypothetical protein